MKNYILSGIITVAVIVIGYFVFLIHQDDILTTNISTQPMTKKLCEAQGGNWGEVEILRDEGDELFYQCKCPNNGLWIREGTLQNCR